MVRCYFQAACAPRPYLSYPEKVSDRELLEDVDQNVSIHISQGQPSHDCDCREEKNQAQNRRRLGTVAGPGLTPRMSRRG